MFDINGQPLSEGDTVQLLCKVVSADPREGVRVRIMNSEMELVVGCKHDEALGGYIADSELAKFVEIMPVKQLPNGIEVSLSEPVTINAPYTPCK